MRSGNEREREEKGRVLEQDRESSAGATPHMDMVFDLSHILISYFLILS